MHQRTRKRFATNFDEIRDNEWKWEADTNAVMRISVKIRNYLFITDFVLDYLLKSLPNSKHIFVQILVFASIAMKYCSNIGPLIGKKNSSIIRKFWRFISNISNVKSILALHWQYFQ